MSIHVRPFREADAAAVSVIQFESFKSYLKDRMELKEPRPAEYWLENARSSTPDAVTETFVAEDENGRLLGFVTVSISLVRRLGYLVRIGVLPRCAHAGIGSQLFQAADGFWRSRNARKVCTCVSSINPGAYAFYLKHGFHREGILKDHFFPGVDEYQLAFFY
ncbi:MAG: GNAT family N-acetyltransferase [Lentisphaeria bacterium]|nr:GNAT family N-acetyltransferase [Lentisphaeria bacterium]